MNRIISSFAHLFVLPIFLFLSSCSGNEPHLYQLNGSTMGTTYNVKFVINRFIPPEELNTIKTAIQNALNEVDNLMSTYKVTSEVSLFNALPVGQSLELSDKTYEVLAYAKKLYLLSDGYFDITIGPLVDLWGFGATGIRETPPSSLDIKKAAKMVGSDHFELISGKIKKLSSSHIDLSAIAKGYGVDQAALSLKNLGINDYLVEVGGEVDTNGHKINGVPWILGIEQPDYRGRKAYTTINLEHASLATSGDYRNFFEYSGERFSHTINPKTLKPVQHKLTSVSVTAENCMIADALATALMVMGEEKGYDFAMTNGISAFFIYRTKSGFGTKVTPKFAKLLN